MEIKGLYNTKYREKPFEDIQIKIFMRDEYENKFISKEIISNEF